MDQNGGQQDSPLSIASNIAGLLTFVFAVAAAGYARLRYLRNSSTEYVRVKTSLSWYKTESTWLSFLVETGEGNLTYPAQEVPAEESGRDSLSSSVVDDEKAAEWPRRRRVGMDRATTETAASAPTQRAEKQMFAFVMEDLLNLEQRLLEIIDDVESRAEANSAVGLSWSLIPGSWHGGRPSVAVAWLGVRTKALELVRQREALTERVQFLQLSMISSRLGYLESRMEKGERGMEEAIKAQAVELRKLESRAATMVEK